MSDKANVIMSILPTEENPTTAAAQMVSRVGTCRQAAPSGPRSDDRDSTLSLSGPTRIKNRQQSQQRRHKWVQFRVHIKHCVCVLLYYVTLLCNNATPASGMLIFLLQQTLAQSKHRWWWMGKRGGLRREREYNLLKNTPEEWAKWFRLPLSPHPAEMKAHPGLRKSPTMHRFTFPTLLQLQSHSSPVNTRFWGLGNEKRLMCVTKARNLTVNCCRKEITGVILQPFLSAH